VLGRTICSYVTVLVGGGVPHRVVSQATLLTLVVGQYNVLSMYHLHEAVLGATMDLDTLLNKVSNCLHCTQGARVPRRVTMAWVGEQGLDHESQDDLTRLFDASSSGHADRTEAHAATNSRRVGRINVDEYVTREAQK